MNGYEKLIVWNKSMRIVEDTYSITSRFPRHEIYGLASQMRRAAVSIPSNIAEGSDRGSKRDFARFLRMALASTSELDTQLSLALRLGYVEKDETIKSRIKLAEIRSMLYVLIGTLV
jgi:four helix bundle protein